MSHGADERSAVGVPDNEVDMITWQNACNWFGLDLFEHRTRDECTVRSLCAAATDVDTPSQAYGVGGPRLATMPAAAEQTRRASARDWQLIRFRGSRALEAGPISAVKKGEER
jgi:hypothetical protein